MSETFYAALGVDADADTDRIEAAYRERVKDAHPDVSDDEDAAERFKRLTEARDVLVDEAARERYDRVGHGAYVRDHLDSTVWTVTGGERDGDRSRAGREGPTGAASGRETAASDGTGTTDDRTAGNYDRYRTSGAASAGDAGGQRRGAGRGTHVGEDPFGGATDWPGDGTTGTEATDGGGADATAGPGRPGARADGWQRAHTATGTYSPSGRTASTGRTSPSPSSVRAGLAAVGPWLVFHVMFVVSALVTVWLLLTLSPTLPTALLGIALLGCSLLASALHIMSRLYS